MTYTTRMMLSDFSDPLKKFKPPQQGDLCRCAENGCLYTYDDNDWAIAEGHDPNFLAAYGYNALTEEESACLNGILRGDPPVRIISSGREALIKKQVIVVDGRKDGIWNYAPNHHRYTFRLSHQGVWLYHFRPNHLKRPPWEAPPIETYPTSAKDIASILVEEP